MSKALLYDSTVCIGCKQCEQAWCGSEQTSYNDAIAAEQIQSDHKMTVVLTRNDKFMRRLCMNCNDPSCASVCPVGALKKTALGPVTYDASKCMGCRYCLVACPFSVPKMNGKTGAQGTGSAPCVLIASPRESRPPARGDLPHGSHLARRPRRTDCRRNGLRDNPSNYVNHIYGLEEVGGTSKALLSAVPFETFGYKSDLTKDPMPMLTYRVPSHIPDFFVPLAAWSWWNLRSRTAAKK